MTLDDVWACALIGVLALTLAGPLVHFAVKALRDNSGDTDRTLLFMVIADYIWASMLLFGAMQVAFNVLYSFYVPGAEVLYVELKFAILALTATFQVVGFCHSLRFSRWLVPIIEERWLKSAVHARFVAFGQKRADQRPKSTLE